MILVVVCFLYAVPPHSHTHDMINTHVYHTHPLSRTLPLSPTPSFVHSPHRSVPWVTLRVKPKGALFYWTLTSRSRAPGAQQTLILGMIFGINPNTTSWCPVAGVHLKHSPRYRDRWGGVYRGGALYISMHTPPCTHRRTHTLVYIHFQTPSLVQHRPSYRVLIPH